MTRAVQAAALVLVAAILSGCGTLANLGGQGWQNTHIYGGVLRDVKSTEEWVADHPLSTDREIQQNIGTVTGVGLIALDVPLSAIGDTLTLPITVPVAIWMSTRGPATVSQKQPAAAPAPGH